MRSLDAHLRAAPYDYEWQQLRKKVLEKDPTCTCTGRFCEHQSGSCKNKQPLGKGGTNALTNLQALCATCHTKKTATEQSRAREIEILQLQYKGD